MKNDVFFGDMFDVVIGLVKQTKPLILNREMAADITVKGASDFVTEVDFSVQNFLQNELLNLYPDMFFMSEEEDNKNIDFSKKVWVLDPVDGTTNLIHNYKMSCVSLGLLENGVPTFGVVYNPFTEELFYAQRGKGAYLNGQRISVTDEESLEMSVIGLEINPYYKNLAELSFKMVQNVFMGVTDIRISGSAAMDMVYLACGRIDGFFARKLKPWDYVAGSAIVIAAGGKVSDFFGNTLDYTAVTDLVATNGKIHQKIVDKISF